MRLRTTLQLASFFPIVLATLFVAFLFTAHFADDGSGTRGMEVPVTGAVTIAIIALLVSGGLYRAGNILVTQIGHMERIAHRARKGDLSVEAPPDHGLEDVSQVSAVFTEMVGELRGYVDLIRAHEALSAEANGLRATLERMRAGQVRVSGALELLNRAEQGATGLMLEQGVFLLTWFPVGPLSKLLDTPGEPTLPESIHVIVARLLAGPADHDGDEAGHRPTVSVKDAIQDAMALCRWAWELQRPEAPVDVTLDARPDDPCTACAEWRDLVQVFAALLLNAGEAMPDGGTVSIDVASDSHGTVQVSLSDQGAGMSEAVRKRCLRPFFSTREGAIGIGLTLASRLVTRWEGRIGLMSEAGEGVTVHVSLPPPRAKASTAAMHETRRLQGPLDILVVEDDEVMREMLANLLRLDQHVVTIVEDGPAAILELREQRFDVVLTDRAMPIMSGDELALAVKARYPGTPVVMVTGMGDEMERRHERPEGVDMIVPKPVIREDLKLALARAMDIAAAADTP